MMPKYILITGTSRGIGLATTKFFINKGYNVIALSRSVFNDNFTNKNLTFFHFDITKQADIDKLVEYIKKRKIKINYILHNAAYLVKKHFEDTSILDYEKVFSVNVIGVAMLTKQLIPYIQKNSHVVTISSMGGVQGSIKFAELIAYSTSKGALITLTETLAETYKNKLIAFNTIALGAVNTEMLKEAFPDYKATVYPDEIAEYLYDFTLNGNKYFNGKVLQVSNSTP